MSQAQNKRGPKPKPIEDTFWERVSIEDGCWHWLGAKTAGYGFMQRAINGKPRTIYAHRFSYELHKGPVPDGHYVCHSCDNPGCVNPDHLWAGRPGDNLEDSFEKGRRDHLIAPWRSMKTYSSRGQGTKEPDQ